MKQVILQSGVVPVIAIWLAFINAVAFSLFWMDKRRARAGHDRIPEKTLLATAFWGGSIGAMLAQQVFRHKTRKQPFRSWLIAIAIFHFLLLAFLLIPDIQGRIFEVLAPITSNFPV